MAKKIKGELRLDHDGDVQLWLKKKLIRWFCRNAFDSFCPAFRNYLKKHKVCPIVFTQLENGIKIELAK